MEWGTEWSKESSSELVLPLRLPNYKYPSLSVNGCKLVKKENGSKCDHVIKEETISKEKMIMRLLIKGFHCGFYR